MQLTYKLEAAADGGLDVGAAKGGDLAKLTGDLDGVVQKEAQAALVAEACCAGNLSEQDWGGGVGQGNRINKRQEEKGRRRVIFSPNFIPAACFCLDVSLP